MNELVRHSTIVSSFCTVFVKMNGIPCYAQQLQLKIKTENYYYRKE